MWGHFHRFRFVPEPLSTGFCTRLWCAVDGERPPIHGHAEGGTTWRMGTAHRERALGQDLNKGRAQASSLDDVGSYRQYTAFLLMVFARRGVSNGRSTTNPSSRIRTALPEGREIRSPPELQETMSRSTMNISSCRVFSFCT